MNIGIDAKEALVNYGGLGNYGRFIINLLRTYAPEHEYYLYSPPVRKSLLSLKVTGELNIIPIKKRFPYLFSSWPPFHLIRYLKDSNISLFHGLSNQLPQGVERSNIPAVVTIHDLVFFHHPHLFKPFEKECYTKRIKESCAKADKIIAVSKQTKADIIGLLGIPEKKVNVVYQGIDLDFKKNVTEADKVALQRKYNLPSRFILYVGSIRPHNNLLSLLKALHEGNIKRSLVVVGNPSSYLQKIVHYISSHFLEQVYFLRQVDFRELPALYRMADLLVYPSIYEGFSIPLLEAMYANIPIITSNKECFKEITGNAALYVDPKNISELVTAIRKVINDAELRNALVSEGGNQLPHFDEASIAEDLISTYKEAL